MTTVEAQCVSLPIVSGSGPVALRYLLFIELHRLRDAGFVVVIIAHTSL